MAPRLPFGARLLAARFVERPNRFVVWARLGDGRLVRAHLADPGRLEELLQPGRRIWLQPAADPRRKTRWSTVLAASPDGGGLISLDATLPNRLIARALAAEALDELADWQLERAEATLGRSRFDFLLRSATGERLALEVKSVTLVEGGVGLFPDAVTARGRRHLEELAQLAGRPGWRAAVLFVAQRPDVRRVRADRRIDPAFADALETARAAGVELLARRCTVDLEAVELAGRLPVG